YTVSHSQHRGNSFSARMRYDFIVSEKRLWWIDVTMDTEKLTAQRMNYRQVVSEDNPSLRYYEYYEPTKMSDKVQTCTAISATGYWRPSGEIYLWYINGGLNLWNSKQTAYRFPESKTEKKHVVNPFVTMRRNILFRDTSLLTVQCGYAMTFGWLEQQAAQARIAYEMPLHGTRIRPCLSLNYSHATATKGEMKGLSRHVLTVAAEVTF
ncbi:MAG: hypothetical protein K2G12_03790, partial [Prevotella sp.]|nr:hypothetical protein [Prevotella sp.]